MGCHTERINSPILLLAHSQQLEQELELLLLVHHLVLLAPLASSSTFSPFQAISYSAWPLPPPGRYSPSIPPSRHQRLFFNSNKCKFNLANFVSFESKRHCTCFGGQLASFLHPTRHLRFDVAQIDLKAEEDIPTKNEPLKLTSSLIFFSNSSHCSSIINRSVFSAPISFK